MSNRPGRPSGDDPIGDSSPSGACAAAQQNPSFYTPSGVNPSGVTGAAAQHDPSSFAFSASAGPSAGLQQDPSSSIPLRIAAASSQGPSSKRGAPSSIGSQLNKLAKRFGPINVDGISVAAMRASVEKELERAKGVKDEVPPTSNNGSDGSQSKDPAKRISYLEGFAKRRQKEIEELEEICEQQLSELKDQDQELDEKDQEIEEKDEQLKEQRQLIELLYREIVEKDHKIRDLDLSLNTMATFVPEDRLPKCKAAIAQFTTGVILDRFSTSEYPDDDNDSENPPWTNDGVGGICIEPEEQEPRLDIATHTSTVPAPVMETQGGFVIHPKKSKPAPKKGKKKASRSSAKSRQHRSDHEDPATLDAPPASLPERD
ncbi:hypothetical protein LTR05_005468 [Lithohypha guttulata]|uniref:Uncharacterized protein n=1 Tax=Lithohypha guttulata TaxID=1690604 RepID=A0AAN7SXQ9_9EURO|nr:hypothetical protein LTR05_005468 [Lithohypha guttulata]